MPQVEALLIYTVPELAEVMRIGKGAAYQRVKQPGFPAVKVGEADRDPDCRLLSLAGAPGRRGGRMSAQRNRPTTTPQGQKDGARETERNLTDSTSNSEARFTVEADEDEMRLLLLYRASKLNALGRERLLGFAEGLLAAGMKKNPRQRT